MMKFDKQKIEDAILALLGLFSFDENRSWKNYDFNVMNELYKKGLIENPANKNKSVYLTQKGMQKAQALIEKMFVLDEK